MKHLRPFRAPLARWAAAAAGALALVSCTSDHTTTGPGATSSEFAAQGNQQGLAVAIAAQERHNPQLLRINGVEGTAVGLTADGTPTVLIFTRAAGVAGLPQRLEGVPVSVQVTGPFTALPAAQAPVAPQAPPPGTGHGRSIHPTRRFARPVPIGVSTGNAGECSAGTIGARVSDGSGNVYALSNNHVYALENDALIGSQVMQPGLYDTKCVFDANNTLGALAAFDPLHFFDSPPSPFAPDTIDAAIALSDVGQLGNATPANGYGEPASTFVAAMLGQAVQKYGRTTSLTRGTVTGIHATVTVGYGSHGYATLVEQIIVQSAKPFIRAGDSGSLMVTDDANANPVGLLFAGTQDGRLAIANRIDAVLDYFEVTIDGK